ncbi:MAG: DUF3575 domain-containing protein [Alistipes sp.]|nr:DUF3575 domain-containing protein [Alistipes sp.]
MKRILPLTIILLFAASTFAQSVRKDSPTDLGQKTYSVGDMRTNHGGQLYLPKIAIGTNALYLMTTSLNAKVELGLWPRWTVDVAALYNPFKLQRNGTNQIWFAQPEMRFWFCQRFERHFVGAHLIYGQYNIGKVGFLTDTFLHNRYKGNGYGAGVSWGYHLPIGGFWATEFSLGVGYMRLNEKKFECYECEDLVSQRKKNYFGPTKLGVSLVFMIR